jgi:GMP reductase
MRIEQDIKLDYKDVLLRPKRSTLGSRKEVDLERIFTFPNCDQTWKGIPIVASNMDHTGTAAMARELYKHNMITCLHKYTAPDQIDSSIPGNGVALTVGLKDQDWSMLDLLLRGNPDIMFICIDVANGYSERFSKYVKEVRKTWPDKVIIAGNVVTGEMTEELILNGADIVKVGIGPGSVCTTRIQTGVGYPQLSAVIECADAAHGVGGFIMADGGCTCPGDVAKAFGGGADFVMLGGMLAGHDECSGEVVGGQKQFYGMSSSAAMDKYSGGVANYRSSEGKCVKVPYKGPVSETVKSILGGLRSACTYTGARTIKQMPKCATFVRVNQQSNEIFGKNG